MRISDWSSDVCSSDLADVIFMVEQIDRRRRQRLVLRNEVMKQPFFAAGVDEQGNTLDFIRLHSVVELGVRPGVREKAIGCFEADARGSLHGFESALKLVTGRREKAEVVHCAAFGSSLRIEKKRLARLRAGLEIGAR